MARDRSPYSNKYKDLANNLGLRPAQVNKIISKYEQRFSTDSNDPIIIEHLSKAKYRKDLRTAQQYLYDLLDGWLIEDCMFLWLKSRVKKIDPKAKVSIICSDKDRVVRPSGVSSDPDFLVKLSNGESKKIELKTGTKLLNEINLKKSSMLKGTLFLFYFLKENKHFFLNVPIEPNRRWGGKMCMAFTQDKIINDIGLREMTTPNLEVIGCTK